MNVSKSVTADFSGWPRRMCLIRLGQPDMSAVAEHSIEEGHNIDFNNIMILEK
jgi:hypothetical protein